MWGRRRARGSAHASATSPRRDSSGRAAYPLNVVWLHKLKVAAALGRRDKGRGREKHLNVRDVVANAARLADQSADFERQRLVLGTAGGKELERGRAWRLTGGGLLGAARDNRILLGFIDKGNQLRGGNAALRDGKKKRRKKNTLKPQRHQACSAAPTSVNRFLQRCTG